ncbi:hypothetical protein LIBO111022_15425 [Listeria booriae]|nr:Uncharacterised protein [Listeria booriae]
MLAIIIIIAWLIAFTAVWALIKASTKKPK